MEDFSDHPSVKLFLEGYKGSSKAVPGSSSKEPITIMLLNKLIEALPYVCYYSTEIIMLKAALTMAFFGLLCIGEYMCSTISDAVIFRQNGHLMKGALNLGISNAKMGKGQMQ